MNRVNLKKKLVEIQNYRKIGDRFRGIYKIFLYFVKKEPKDDSM